MRRTYTALAFAILAFAHSAPAVRADEQPVILKDAPGKEVVENNCASCHSMDYIKMNSPFLKGEGWEKEVHKMIEVYHAPVEPADAKAIIEYLSKNYGG